MAAKSVGDSFNWNISAPPPTNGPAWLQGSLLANQAFRESLMQRATNKAINQAMQTGQGVDSIMAAQPGVFAGMDPNADSSKVFELMNTRLNTASDIDLDRSGIRSNDAQAFYNNERGARVYAESVAEVAAREAQARASDAAGRASDSSINLDNARIKDLEAQLAKSERDEKAAQELKDKIVALDADLYGKDTGFDKEVQAAWNEKVKREGINTDNNWTDDEIRIGREQWIKGEKIRRSSDPEWLRQKFLEHGLSQMEGNTQTAAGQLATQIETILAERQAIEQKLGQERDTLTVESASLVAQGNMGNVDTDRDGNKIWGPPAKTITGDEAIIRGAKLGLDTKDETTKLVLRSLADAAPGSNLFDQQLRDMRSKDQTTFSRADLKTINTFKEALRKEAWDLADEAKNPPAPGNNPDEALANWKGAKDARAKKSPPELDNNNKPVTSTNVLDPKQYAAALEVKQGEFAPRNAQFLAKLQATLEDENLPLMTEIKIRQLLNSTKDTEDQFNEKGFWSDARKKLMSQQLSQNELVLKNLMKDMEEDRKSTLGIE